MMFSKIAQKPANIWANISYPESVVSDFTNFQGTYEVFGCWDSNSHHLGNESPPRNHLTRLIQPKVCQNVPLRTALEVNFTLFN